MKKYNIYNKYQITLTLVLFTTINLSAASKDGVLEMLYNNIFLVLGGLIMVGALYAIYKTGMMFLDLQRIEVLKEKGLYVAEDMSSHKKESLFSKMMTNLTKAVPISKEADIDLGHNYDGIRELDNSLPPWWVYMFNITILFAVVYMYWYHFSDNGISQKEEYRQEMVEGDLIKRAFLLKQADAVNENNVVMLESAKDLAEAKTLFNANCATCHREDGGGSAGPNLTDEYWIHGGDIKSIFSTIKYGVPGKTMIAWKEQLRSSQMQQLASYILTMQGTNPENPKAPEGELIKK
jgi:cytochrome c oxidase cbb3-type subunit 3